MSIPTMYKTQALMSPMACEFSKLSNLSVKSVFELGVLTVFFNLRISVPVISRQAPTDGHRRKHRAWRHVLTSGDTSFFCPSLIKINCICFIARLSLPPLAQETVQWCFQPFVSSLCLSRQNILQPMAPVTSDPRGREEGSASHRLS